MKEQRTYDAKGQEFIKQVLSKYRGGQGNRKTAFQPGIKDLVFVKFSSEPRSFAFGNGPDDLHMSVCRDM